MKTMIESNRYFQRCWMVWRRCCCRLGVYPLLLAPVLTAGCILSLYSTAGCKFIDLQVGFIPSNPSWNQSDVSFGLWHYHSTVAVNQTGFLETFHEDCQLYSDAFEEDFIDNDRTWRVARIMAIISGISSTLAAIMAWLFCVTALPKKFFWSWLLNPLLMIAFVGEGSKFLIFDVGICRDSVWNPSGANSPPQSAQECSLGRSAFFAIAASSVLLIGMLMACLKTPEQRTLDPNYGLQEPTHELDLEADPEQHIKETHSYMEESVYDDVYTEDPSVVSEATPSPDGPLLSEQRDSSVQKQSTEDVRENETQADPGESSMRVSESRLATMKAMRETLSDHDPDEENVIEEFVSDLNATFQ